MVQCDSTTTEGRIRITNRTAAAGLPPTRLLPNLYEQKRGVDDDYIQPGNLYRLMSPKQQKELAENIAGSLGKVPKDLQEKMVDHFRKADQSYGDGVARVLGLI